MSVKPKVEKAKRMQNDQPGFSFTEESMKQVRWHISKYPDGRQASAVIPLLDIAQRQNNGWVSQAVIETVAELLQMPSIRVHEVATFYTMFNLKPVGKYHVQVCGTTPCMLCGAEDIVNSIEKHLKIKVGQTTGDNNFTLSEVECLGACANAPMVQINDDYFEDLTTESMVKLLDDLAAGKKVKVGSQIGRKCSEPYEATQTKPKARSGGAKAGAAKKTAKPKSKTAKGDAEDA